MPSGSMKLTINEEEQIFVEKISKLKDKIKQHDIIVFYDEDIDSECLVKRVIAVGGQTIDLRDGKVYIDNNAIEEDYVNGQNTYKLYPSIIQYPYTIPDDSIWVMGDNRENSIDSRYFGSIKRDSVIGRATYVYLPFDNFRSIK